MNFMERNALIEGLIRRGFVESKNPLPVGWIYIHREDGMRVRFDAAGVFKIESESESPSIGTATKKEHILDIIDRIATAL